MASSLDASTERIVRYLNGRDIGINVLFFQVFQSGADQLLSRAWLVDPIEVPGDSTPSLVRAAKRQWDEQSYFAALQSKCPRATTQVARRLLEWSKSNVSRVWWGQGKQSGSFVSVFEQGSTKQYLFAAYTGAPKSKPTIQLYFSYWAKHPPFESAAIRSEILRRLNEIPGISLPAGAIDKWPTIPLERLANEAVLERFLSVLSWLVGELTRHAESLETATSL